MNPDEHFAQLVRQGDMRDLDGEDLMALGSSFANLYIRHTSDAQHSLQSPLAFTERDAGEAAHLSAAVTQRLDLVTQCLHNKILKRVVITSTPQITEPARVRLIELLRKGLIDGGVDAERIPSAVLPAGVGDGSAWRQVSSSMFRSSEGVLRSRSLLPTHQ